MSEAVILAGGLGTRLRGVLPDDIPKPMAPIGGRPLLEFLLAMLQRKGFCRVILSLGYQAEQVVKHFGDHFGALELVYEIERQPLGTGGALRGALARCQSDRVFVLNGDTYLDLEVAEIEARWQHSLDPLIVARHVSDTSRYGRLEISGDCLIGFEEKGRGGPGLINSGVYVFPRKISCEFPADDVFSLERDFLATAMSRLSFRCFVSRGYFIDIGVPEDYARARLELPGLASPDTHLSDDSACMS